MTIFRRAIINIIRQPLKSIALLLIILTLGATLAGTISIRAAMLITEDNLLAQTPAVSTIVIRDIAEIVDFPILQPTRENMLAIGELSYVRVHDFNMRMHFTSSDLRWSSSNPSTPDGRFFFTIKGINNPSVTEIIAGTFDLVDGRTFTQAEIDNSELVAIIPRDFAETNDLTIGSMMIIDNTMNFDGEMLDLNLVWHLASDEYLNETMDSYYIISERLEIEVIGIIARYVEDYGYNLCIECEIFMPFGVTESLLSFRNNAMIESDFGWMIGGAGFEREPWIQSVYILYDPRNLDEFSLIANELLPDIWEMTDLRGANSHIIASMDTVVGVADAIQLGATIAIVAILSLTISLFLRDRRNEIGIYMALGDKKYRVILQILIEIGLVSVLGISFALFAGNFASYTISRNMLEQNLMNQLTSGMQYNVELSWELALFNPRAFSIEELMTMYNVSLEISTVIMFVSIGIVVVLISTVIPILYILKLKPKEILL